MKLKVQTYNTLSAGRDGIDGTGPGPRPMSRT